ncbi:FAD-dependent oxidoreductase [Fodinicola acaciae]|uniref:FAD-dependent oxidoreductase n=1 Tax=Fodinicola acaciae TaxID=2681555 RepID=UPI0013D2B41A|nr:FAD-dependent oxidoreductase [Fodinicola acaciae]
MDSQVLVVGGGPTGLTMACALAQRGIRVRVIDAAAGPATTSRALGLQPRGAEVLTRVKALGDLPERALPVQDITLHAGGTTIRVPVGEEVAPGQRATLVISQAEVEGQLRDRLAELNAKVEWGTRLVGYEQDAGAVTATVEVNGEKVELRSDWLVGCDGGHSAVRKLTGVNFPGNPLLQDVLLTDVRADWPLPRSGSTAWAGDGREVGVFPLPGGFWRFFTRLDGPSDDAYATAREVVTEFAKDRMDLPPESLRSIQWASIFRVQERLVDHYRFGRVFLAGDAAHLHSPTGGQGMNTGIGDAENLAWKLALVESGRAAQSLLDTYEAERRPVAQAVLGGTTAATKLLVGGTPLTALLRMVIVPLVQLRAFRKALFLRTSGLTITYRGGPLADRAGRKPAAGDRVPDIACAGGTTLQRIVAGGHWVMLNGADHLRQVAEEALGDVVAAQPARAGLTDAILVRPDGHVAWRGTSVTDLRDWLTSRLRLR